MHKMNLLMAIPLNWHVDSVTFLLQPWWFSMVFTRVNIEQLPEWKKPLFFVHQFVFFCQFPEHEDLLVKHKTLQRTTKKYNKKVNINLIKIKMEQSIVKWNYRGFDVVKRYLILKKFHSAQY